MSNAVQATHEVVSMLAGEQKISLFTITGSVVDLKHNEDYDTAEIVKFLRANLTGSNSVKLDLSKYTKIPAFPEIASTLEAGGIEITQIIDGVEVQGIFYPKKAQTVVAIADEIVEIPALDNLLRHATRAKEYGIESVKAFLTRMLPVLKNRKHSAEDLMQFIGNSEMPLTLSGQVICYKRLNKSTEDFWVDPYSRTVKQRVGTIVRMAEVDVDPSRYNSCSNGLHVANRSYFDNGNYSADNTFVVLVNPEDFIAVPKGEHGKARVTQYQIIGMLTSKSHGEISQGYVKDDDSLKRLIANAIEGRFVPAFEIANVNKLGYVNTTPIENVDVRKIGSASESSLKAARSLDADPQPKALPANQETKPMEDGSKIVRDIKPQTMPPEVQKAFTMLREGKESKAVIARATNTSTRSLDRWMDKYGYEAWKNSVDSAVKADAATETPENMEAVGDMFDRLHTEAESKRPTMPAKAKPPTRQEIMRDMINTAKTAEDYKAIIDYKKKAKNAWDHFGVTKEEVAIIEKGASKPASRFDVYLLTKDRIIDTIKIVREIYGIGLKEGKDMVESGKVVDNQLAADVTRMTRALTDKGILFETVLHGAPRPKVREVPIKSTVQTQTAPLSKAQQARLLFEQKKFAELREFKKAAKKGWDVLGFNETEIGQIISK